MAFLCPLCRSRVYERVTVLRPSGKPYETDLYQCAGCSVLFRSADKFTRRARFEPGREFSPVVIHFRPGEEGE